jgi:DNA-binding MarR family transcriptional regulator
MLPTTCHCTRLRRAARAVTRHYDLALAESGLTTTQFSLMRTISRLDQPYISTLADATGLERSTLGRNLRPLEKAGLVEFGQGEDARTRLVRLTRKGKRTLNDAVAQWQVAQDRLNAVLGDKKLTALESLLDEVIAS